MPDYAYLLNALDAARDACTAADVDWDELIADIERAAVQTSSAGGTNAQRAMRMATVEATA